MIRGIEDDTLLKWEAKTPKRVAIPPRAPSPAVLDEIAIIQPEDTGRKSLTEMLRSQPAPLRPNVPHSLLVHLLFSVARLVVPEDTVDTRRRVIDYWGTCRERVIFSDKPLLAEVCERRDPAVNTTEGFMDGFCGELDNKRTRRQPSVKRRRL